MCGQPDAPTVSTPRENREIWRTATAQEAQDKVWKKGENYVLAPTILFTQKEKLYQPGNTLTVLINKVTKCPK